VCVYGSAASSERSLGKEAFLPQHAMSTAVRVNRTRTFPLCYADENRRSVRMNSPLSSSLRRVLVESTVSALAFRLEKSPRAPSPSSIDPQARQIEFRGFVLIFSRHFGPVCPSCLFARPPISFARSRRRSMLIRGPLILPLSSRAALALIFIVDFRFWAT